MPTKIESPKLDDLNGKLAAKQAEMRDIFAQAGPDIDLSKVKQLDGDTQARVEAVRALNDELDDLLKQRDELASLVKMAADVAADEDGAVAAGRAEKGGDSGPAAAKSLGELITESSAFKSRTGESAVDYDLKTLLTTAAGFAPEVTRTGVVVDYAQVPVQLVDLIPTVPTSQAAVLYMQEITHTNNAAETAEGAAFAEQVYEWDDVTSPVRKITASIPVTDEQLEDVPGMSARLNNMLPRDIRVRLDAQIYGGNGTGVNLEGITQRTGIQTQAKATDNVPDAIFKAMTKIRTGTNGHGIPNLVILNPVDWQTVRLLKTNDGAYIWGSPASAGPESVFGVNVLQLFAATAATGCVVDTMQLELAVRRGVDVRVGYVDDQFTKGTQTVRADMRAALQVYRPAAICTVTGLDG